MDKRTCSVDGCERAFRAKGLCITHYSQSRRPVRASKAAGRPRLDIDRRFWSKVSKTESCWDWTGAKTLDGYGKLPRRGESDRAHRISYEMLVGAIPEGAFIDHTCHNPGCVNPEHLRVASNKQNQENLAGPQSNSTSGILGVSWKMRDKKWQAAVGHNGKTIHGGYFDTAEEAGHRVTEMRLSIFTHNNLDRAAAKQ